MVKQAVEVGLPIMHDSEMGSSLVASKYKQSHDQAKSSRNQLKTVKVRYLSKTTQGNLDSKCRN